MQIKHVDVYEMIFAYGIWLYVKLSFNNLLNESAYWK